MITNYSQMTGAIGESLVVAELIKKGWVAMNVNAAVRNCKAIDLIESEICKLYWLNEKHWFRNENGKKEAIKH